MEKQWQELWAIICDMAYLRRNICHELIAVMPYDKKIPDEITLDYIWEQYSNKYHDVYIVPEFKSLHVPQELFETPGTRHWFEHSFPNCLVTFW